MRVERLNGIPCFSMFEDRELIEYMHSLIPFHHPCCDIHSVCTKKKKSSYKEFTKCTFMHGVPRSQCGSPMREGSISTTRHNKSLQIYELITTTWLLFFSVPLKCSSETGEMVLTRVPACASLRKYIRDKKGAKEAFSHCATLSTSPWNTANAVHMYHYSFVFFFLIPLSSSQNISELENKWYARGKSSEQR